MSLESGELHIEEQLLQKTLEHALANVKFYGKAVQRAGHLSSPSLKDFPIIDKNTVEANFEDFLYLDRFPDYVISSGGTMAGAGAFSLRAQEEYEAIYFHNSGRHPRKRYEYFSPDGFAIDLFTHTNGYHWRKPPGLPVLPFTLEQEAHALFLVHILRDGLPIQGHRCYPVHLQGQCGPMRTLTGYIDVLGEKVIPASSSLGTLVYGSHTTRVWKDRYQSIWGSRPRELYGLSEFAPGSAQQCDTCGGFHFRTCWTEFLALDNDEPTNCGDARLVLTSLFPFVQMQPRIRYYTGDIVSVGGVCPATGRISFKFRGREKNSVLSRVDDKTVLFSEVEVQEVLDQMKSVACQTQVSELRIWESTNLPKPPYALGYPRFQIFIEEKEETTLVCIEIEVTFEPDVEKQKSGHFRELFVELLFCEAPGIEEAINSGCLSLNISLMPQNSLRLNVKSSA